MFKLATLPQLRSNRFAQTVPAPSTRPAAKTAVQIARPATADIRIRRFENATVNEDTYSAILPREGVSPAELMRVITEACKDLPEFQVRNEQDEQFILTLTLKG